MKLNIPLIWDYAEWEDYYSVTREIIDAAVLWRKDSYIPGKMMCLSFQHQKHLSLGRGGMILLDNEEDYKTLKKMVYDGREPNIPWRSQNVKIMGYHYYMTPETAAEGLKKLDRAINTEPRKWKYLDWPVLTEMDVFS
jgi:dTDP-4-amino-4,6-dideoxygalactose transaminase